MAIGHTIAAIELAGGLRYGDFPVVGFPETPCSHINALCSRLNVSCSRDAGTRGDTED
jgi:hypothetical protein